MVLGSEYSKSGKAIQTGQVRAIPFLNANPPNPTDTLFVQPGVDCIPITPYQARNFSYVACPRHFYLLWPSGLMAGFLRQNSGKAERSKEMNYCYKCSEVVGDTGLEPVTSTV
jgi:hypothetical protein